MQVIRKPAPILQRQFALMIRQHRIGEGSRHSDNHPPSYPLEELPALAPDKTADEFPIQLSNIQTNQRPNDQEEAVAYHESEFLALPSGYHDSQQSPQVPEELAVELDPLASCCGGLGRGCAGALESRLGDADGGSFLFGDGIAEAVDESEEEGQVDGSGDLGAVGEVEGRQLGDDLLERLFRDRGGREEFGWGDHDGGPVENDFMLGVGRGHSHALDH